MTLRKFVCIKWKLIFVFIITTTSFVFALERTSLSYSPSLPQNFQNLPGPQSVSAMPVELLNSNPEAVQLRFSDPPLEIETVEINGVQYQSILLSGEGSSQLEGEPEIPHVSRLIMIGNTGNVNLEITSQHFTLQNNISPKPTQSISGENYRDEFIPPNPDIYFRNEWYPPVVAEITEPATLRDIRFVVLTTYPVQVNPVTGQMRVYDNLEVSLVNTGGVGINEIQIEPNAVSPGFRKLYSAFENFQNSSLDALPVFPGNYLVVCRDDTNVTKQAQRLVDWKRRKGINATIATTTQTGTSTGSIRNYISNQYTASNGQLEFVCILGDPDAAGAYDIDTDIAQLDNQYGVINFSGGPNPDPVPDLAVGRLSAASESELRAIVTKTINYESHPLVSDPTWFTRAWCVAHSGSIASNPSTKEYTRQIMLQRGLNTGTLQIYGGHVSATDVNNKLSTGISVLNDRMSVIGEMNNSDLNGVPATQKLPFVMVITCGTGTFNGEGALSEEWLAPNGQTDLNPKGAIGCVGLSGTGTHVPFNNIIDAGAMYGLYVQDIQEQGIALVAAKLQLYRNYQTFHSSDVSNFSFWANLMGDPSTPIWSHFPDSLTVTKPESLLVGANNISLTVVKTSGSVPVSNALVCVFKDSVNYSRGYTNASGQINLPLTSATVGYLKLTITKEDIRPFVDSVRVGNSLASLAFKSLILDDDTYNGTYGDENHIANAGETIDLPIKIFNSGTANTVTSINGTLSSSSPLIQVTDAVKSYPNILAGDSALPVTAFRIHIQNVFNGETIPLFLDLTSSAGTHRIRINILPTASDVLYANQTFLGAGGTLDPGESGNFEVTFINSGSRSFTNATGILRSLDPLVIISDSIGSYGSVSPGSRDSNDVDTYAISCNPNVLSGRLSPAYLIMTDANGFRDSTLFYISTGTPVTTNPTGPDAYGYYAYDNAETQPANSACTYNWIEIAPGLGGSGTNLNFSDLGEDDDDYTSLPLPFNFSFYGQTFTTMTICSNGWLAFGTYQMWDFRNYRMGSPIGPPNQVAAYWDDLKTYAGNGNCFYKFDSATHQIIVEWRMRTLWSSVDENFQVILYDPAFYPSVTNDGKIKIQYQTVNLSINLGINDNDYASVGIQNADHSIGLDYYYWNTYASPASAPLQNNRAIMFTTDATGIFSPYLRLAAPNNGESWYIGRTYNFTWLSSSISGTVDIQLKRNYPAGVWENIFTGTPNDSYEQWLVSGTASANARVRVLSSSNPAIGDTSDANFSIISPTITLVTPNGGEVWQPTDIRTLSWTTDGLNSVKVEINRSYPSATWTVIDSNNTVGHFDWIVTGPSTNTARFRVTGTTLPLIGDSSNASFTINNLPQIFHEPHADSPTGVVSFRAFVTDELAGVSAKLFYRLIGNASFDSLALAPTGNANEFSATIGPLVEGKYEYYLRALDSFAAPSTYPYDGSTLFFDVGSLCNAVLSYDDGTSEQSNWINGQNFKWAVKFTPLSFPYDLCSAQFGVSSRHPDTSRVRVKFSVHLADGVGGLPGTVLYTDTTGTSANTIGSLPNGNTWVNVLIRSGGLPLQLNSDFYLSVENLAPIINPEAFSLDTNGVRSHRSYFYDDCLGAWHNEDDGLSNNRPGNRLIRAVGFALSPPTIVVRSSGNDAIISWTATGAAYYKIYSALTSDGPYSTLLGTTSTANFTDVNAVPANIKKFYRVIGSDLP